MAWQLAGEPVIGALILGSALIAGGVELFVTRPKRRKRWKAAAEQLGLMQVGNTELEGTIDALQIHAQTNYNNDRQAGETHVKVSTHINCFDELTISGYGFIPKVFKGIQASRIINGTDAFDIVTGDSTFDPHVFVHGTHPHPLALLSHDVREKLRHLIADGGALEAGTLTMVYDSTPGSSDALVAMVNEAIALVKSLAPELSEVPQLYARNIANDPELDVVKANFKQLLLCKWAPWQLVTDTAVELWVHKDVELSLRALYYLATQAEEHWGEHEETRFLERLADQLLDCLYPNAPELATDTALQCDAMDLLASQTHEQPSPNHLDVVHKMLASETQEVACHAAILIQKYGSKESIPVLVQHLEPTEGQGVLDSATLQVAICDALSTLGDRTTVEPLQRLADSRFYRVSPSAQKAAKHAIAAIQERLEGAGAGQLAMVEESGDGGALSLADGREGDLSLSDNADDTDE